MLKPLLKKSYRKIRRKISHLYTEEELLLCLQKLEVKGIKNIFVHSALSNLGNVEGGAGTVINTLQKMVGPEGTILMPGFTIDGSMRNTLENMQKNETVFNYILDPPTIGIIPRTFFYTEGTLRSIHPTHSVLAKGQNASYFTKDIEYADTNFGVGTPLHKLIESKAYIMGLGSDIAHVTFYHVIEDVIKNFPIDVYEGKPYQVKVLNSQGKILQKKYFAHRKQEKRIELKQSIETKKYFEKELLHKYGLEKFKYGAANCWIISADSMYECIRNNAEKGLTIYS